MMYESQYCRHQVGFGPPVRMLGLAGSGPGCPDVMLMVYFLQLRLPETDPWSQKCIDFLNCTRQIWHRYKHQSCFFHLPSVEPGLRLLIQPSCYHNKHLWVLSMAIRLNIPGNLKFGAFTSKSTQIFKCLKWGQLIAAVMTGDEMISWLTPQGLCLPWECVSI